MPADDQCRKYARTTCGLLGFVLFFMGTFLAFIVADEINADYYYLTIGLGSGMLILTIACYAFVIIESRSIKSLEEQQEQELLLEPQPGPALPLQPLQQPEESREEEPYWDDRTRHDTQYVRQVLGFAPGFYESTSSEDYSDPDLLELRRMGEHGIPPDSLYPIAGTSKEFQGEGSIKREGVADAQLDFAKAGPSRVDGGSFKATGSRYDDIPLKDMSGLSLRGSSKRASDSEEKQAEVSAALSQLSLDSSENQASKMSTQDPSSIDSEDKSNEHHSEHSETSTKSKDTESSRLKSKKET